jgi:predicted nucleic acid-binding protein
MQNFSAELEYKCEKTGNVRRADAMIAAAAMNNNARLYTLDKHSETIKQFGLELF